MLMPLSFASILGGMTTLIGTPPNLIVASFRAGDERPAFGMFDFAPVGLAVAATGIVFIIIAARFLVPQRNRASAPDFNIGAYLTEARVTEAASAVGMALREVEVQLEKVDAQVVGLVRDKTRIPRHRIPSTIVEAGDILVIEADSKVLGGALTKARSEAGRGSFGRDAQGGHGRADGAARGRGAPGVRPWQGVRHSNLRLRRRLGINLLAISRRAGARSPGCAARACRQVTCCFCRDRARRSTNSWCNTNALPLAEPRAAFPRQARRSGRRAR